MRNRRVNACLLSGLLLVVSGLASQPSRAMAPPPVLGQLQVIHAADRTARKAIDVERYVITVAIFDTPNGEWLVRFDRGGDDAISIKTFFVTVDEVTGLVCMRYEFHGVCAAQTNVSDEVAAAKAKVQAKEEARKSPAPDLNGMMAALLRYELSSKNSYTKANSSVRYYVSLQPPGGGASIDLPAEVIAELKGMGIIFLPGSAWTPPGNVISSPNMRMSIAAPLRRPDGKYDVEYSFYCGGLCGSTHIAVMEHDASGWHVITSTMTSIS